MKMWNLQFFLDLKKKCQRIFYAKINKLYKEILDVRLFFSKNLFSSRRCSIESEEDKRLQFRYLKILIAVVVALFFLLFLYLNKCC